MAVLPLTDRLLKPLMLSSLLLPSTALPVMERDLPAPANVPWVLTVLPVRVEFSVRLRAPP